MKRIISFLLVFISTAVCNAGVLVEYSGLFTTDRSEGAAISNYMLLEKPKKLSFQFTDQKGVIRSGLKVTEITLTSDPSVSEKKIDGIQTVELTEPGIYEIKVQPDGAVASETGFILKVIDTGETPTIKTPVKLVQNASDSKNMTPDTSTLKLPPSITIPIVPPPSSISLPIEPQKPAPKPVEKSQIPQVLPVPASRTASPSKPQDDVRDVGPWECTLVQPASGAYADPFKPIEIRFNHDLPAPAKPENIVKLYCFDAAGKLLAVDGRWFSLGKNGVQFIPTRLISGAVYQVKVFAPEGFVPLQDFRFEVFPEVFLTLSSVPEGFAAELRWKANPDLMPLPEAQVTRLCAAELVVYSGTVELMRLALNSDLPSFGSYDGLRYRGEPYHFTLTIPKEKITDSTSPLSIALNARFSGTEKPIQVAKTFLSSTVSSSFVPVVVSQPPSPATDTSIVASKTLEASETESDISQQPAIDEIPATVATAATELHKPVESPKTTPASLSVVPPIVEPVVVHQPIILPVVPITDPGPNALISPKTKFIVGEGGQNDYIAWPKGIYWAPDGALWVSESQNRRILRFTDEGKLISAFGKKGKGPGMLGLPIDLAMSGSNLFIADTAAHCIHMFNTSGHHIRDIGSWGVKTGQVDLPHGIEITNDQLWVSDRGNCRILRFSFDGSYRGGFGKKGELPGYLSNPVSVRVRDNRVCILEGDSGRVQWFSADGKPLGNFGSGAKDATALHVDPWGYIWVADGEGHRILRFDASGKSLKTMESPIGGKPWIPTSISVRSDGLIAIGDGESRSIHLFQLSKP